MFPHTVSLLSLLIAVAQVLSVPGRVGLHEHRDVAPGSIYGTLPKGVSHDIYHHFPYLGWQHSVCECIKMSFSVIAELISDA